MTSVSFMQVQKAVIFEGISNKSSHSVSVTHGVPAAENTLAINCGTEGAYSVAVDWLFTSYYMYVC